MYVSRLSMLHRHLTARRAGIALGVACALALAPPALADQVSSPLEFNVNSAGLTTTAPTIAGQTEGGADFSTSITGNAQAVSVPLGAWSVSDLTGSNQGWQTTLTYSQPTRTSDSSTTAIGTDPTLDFNVNDVSAGTHSGYTAPTANSDATDIAPGTGDSDGATLLSADSNQGQGVWDVAADQDSATSLTVHIPYDVSAGTYTSTLTFTSAQNVGS